MARPSCTAPLRSPTGIGQRRVGCVGDPIDDARRATCSKSNSAFRIQNRCDAARQRNDTTTAQGACAQRGGQTRQRPKMMASQDTTSRRDGRDVSPRNA
eukprot:8391691-Alexandrium_andersonii.AAC.1